jgi:acyl carrier protein
MHLLVLRPKGIAPLEPEASHFTSRVQLDVAPVMQPRLRQSIEIQSTVPSPSQRSMSSAISLEGVRTASGKPYPSLEPKHPNCYPRTVNATMQKLQEVFCDLFEDDDIVVSRNTGAADVDGWDSLMHVTLMLEVERAFGVRFSSGEVADLVDVGQLVDLVESKVSG